MYSSRLDWSARPNVIAQLLAEKRRCGDAILDLTESNPTQAGFVYPIDEISQALADPRAFRYDPEPMGLLSARQTISGYYAHRGVAVPADRVLLTASTSEAYAYLFKLLADPGDEVLVPRPSYPLFEYLARLESVHIRQYPLFYDHGWHIDFGALEASVTPRTRAVVIVNPNNPTGSYLKRRELSKLVNVCDRNNLALISDEVFADYPFGADPERVTTIAGLEGITAFAVSGLSKIVGLPQMKLGWIVSNSRAALDRLETIADTYLSVGTPVQIALPTLMAARFDITRQITERTQSNLDWLAGEVEGTNVRLLKVEGGWSAILQVPRVRSEEEHATELLRRGGVLVQPGFFYDFDSEAYLIVSLLTQQARFRAVASVFEPGSS